MSLTYRELVEESIEKKRKLAAALTMKADAEQALVHANDCVVFNTRSLEGCEGKLQAIEATLPS